MVLCTSCRNKSSTERCSNNALPGISLCGTHARVKSPRLWNIVNDIDKKITLISKTWKGYFVRKMLALSGPGVIKRSICNNEDELVSLEPISKLNAIDYFGFEENGKVYGFDIKTIIQITLSSLTPINPYTRQELKINDRKRLREIYGYRLRNKLELSYPNNQARTVDSILVKRWTQICQIAEENGFFNINPDLFLSLNKTQLYIFLSMIHNDLKTWSAEHKVPSKRFLYVFWTNNILKKFSREESHTTCSFFVSTILLSILYDSIEPYNICFIIMSALYRL